MSDSIDDLVSGWKRELPGVDEMREQIVVRIQRISRHLAAEGTSSATADGLTMWQFKTLMALRRKGPPYESSPSSLAEILGLSRGAITSRLGWLDDLGLIEREHERGDRRRVVVRLTREGHEALERIAGLVDERESAAFANLDDDERTQLAGLLRKMVLALEDPARDAAGAGR